jgi:hypothetical protein
MSTKMTVVASGAVIALVALVVSGYLLIAKQPSRSAPGRASEVKGADPSANTAALMGRLERLEHAQARLVVETAVRGDAAGDKAPETKAAAAPSPPSAAETLEWRVGTYTAVFDAEPRDPAGSRAYEGAIGAYFEQQAPGALQGVECHTRTCRLTLTHGAGKTRDELGMLWGGGPLANGSFDYVSEDGTRTYAFVGMPGYALPILDAHGVLVASDGTGASP